MRRRSGASARCRPGSGSCARRLGILTAWTVGGTAPSCSRRRCSCYRLGTVPRPETLPLPVATIQYSDGTGIARVGTVDTVVPLSRVPSECAGPSSPLKTETSCSEHGFSAKGTARAAVSDVFGGDSQGGSGLYPAIREERLPHQRAHALAQTARADDLGEARPPSTPKTRSSSTTSTPCTSAAASTALKPPPILWQGRFAPHHRPGRAAAPAMRDPGYYDPSTNLQAAQGRWDFVLNGMVTMKKLSAAIARRRSFRR